MDGQYVGIDLHRRRSVIVRKDSTGQVLDTVRIVNDPVALAAAVAAAGVAAEVVVVEATYGWYWAADVLTECGVGLHLAHPLGNNWGHRRVKNDQRDAEDLADLLRLGRLAEGWIAPPEVRELRELVRYRVKLRQLRSGLRAQVHSVFAKEGVTVPVTDLFGAAGNRLLDTVELADAYRQRVDSLREVLAVFDHHIARLDELIGARLADDDGYHAIQTIPGIGPILAAVFVAEIGDVHRFDDPGRLASWAGLTPRHRESDGKVKLGSITKQGSRLVRWAAIEAVARGGPGPLRAHQRRLAEAKGTKVARVAAARKLLILVYYGLRDGHIRCLHSNQS